MYIRHWQPFGKEKKVNFWRFWNICLVFYGVFFSKCGLKGSLLHFAFGLREKHRLCMALPKKVRATCRLPPKFGYFQRDHLKLQVRTPMQYSNFGFFPRQIGARRVICPMILIRLPLWRRLAFHCPIRRLQSDIRFLLQVLPPRRRPKNEPIGGLVFALSRWVFWHRTDVIMQCESWTLAVQQGGGWRELPSSR